MKSPDLTTRRQAAEKLVPYSGDASKELVRMISEEADAVATDMLSRVMRGDLTDLFSHLLGAPPWRTPFMASATDTLVAIGKPSVPHILDQLTSESIGAEQILEEAAKRSAQAQTEAQPNALETFQQWGFLFGATGGGLRIGITRETLANALRGHRH